MNDTTKQGWKQRKLGDYFRIKHGYAFKGEFFAQIGEYILLTPGNFQSDGGLKLKGEKEKYYTGKFPPEFLLNRGDFLVVMTDILQNAPILGSPALIKEDSKFLHNQRLGKIIGLKENDIDRKFLYHLFNSSKVRNQIKSSATGATVKHTAPERIYNVEIEVPPLPTQRKIASILSAYDDLIENNTRRIKILEEMAQALYREWFVKFRFPGHEKVRMVETELGMVPEGWKITELNNFIVLSNGKSIKPGGNGQYIVYGSNGIIGGSDEYNYENGIIIGRVGAYCGSIKYCRKRFWASDNTIVAIPNENSPDLPFIFHLLQDMELNKYAGGAAQPLLTQTTLKKLQIIVPPDEIRRKFNSFVENLLAQRDNLIYKSANLRRTRDLLLPKLISGEVDVENINMQMPDNNI